MYFSSAVGKEFGPFSEKIMTQQHRRIVYGNAIIEILYETNNVLKIALCLNSISRGWGILKAPLVSIYIFYWITTSVLGKKML